MKRLLSAIASVAAILSMSCSDDKGGIMLAESEKTLYSGETYQIEAESASGSALTYTVENEYHATVSDKGLVTAGFVGQTDVVVSDGSEARSVSITVAPRHTLYADPCTEWGTPKEQIIQRYGTPDLTSDAEGTITYYDYSPAAERLVYHFDGNNALKGVSVMVKTPYGPDIADFMAERYYLLSYDPDLFTYMYANGQSVESVSVIVGVTLFEVSYWVVMYVPNNAEAKERLMQ